MTPVDHLLLPEAALLPALIVVRLPSGLTHFVVAWRRHGRFMQVMDPATGRRWRACRQFLGEIYVHTHPVAAAAWREWAGSEESLSVLRRRLRDLQLSSRTVTEMIATASADPDWRSLAALDAATRTATAITQAGGLRRGRQSARVLAALVDRAQSEVRGGAPLLPAPYWSVRPAPAGPDGIDLDIAPGSHVAIVGQSGSGKSSLVGLLLGWHRPATGQVVVDNELLDGRCLKRLRRETAWVDPAVQIWNRSLLENLRYGALSAATVPLGAVIEAAALRGVLEKLPDGLQTVLGEGGALVSGGEGQRVRLGRSLLRPGVRLAILDEPFRGLDRERRRELLAQTRAWWRGITLVCITHDVGETHTFNRVLVVEDGRIVEDGSPAALAAQAGSRYRSMLDAEAAVRQELGTGVAWRRLRLEEGQLCEDGHGAGK
ncbi:MAG: ATP-binding cassette domain-containing protein [Deltaproteobacteria bacterium]|nr:ATP-binding cassette domain-containing protein [Deltaproteobacteria bacterium]